MCPTTYHKQCERYTFKIKAFKKEQRHKLSTKKRRENHQRYWWCVSMDTTGVSQMTVVRC